MPFFMRFIGTGTPPKAEAIATAANQMDPRMMLDRLDRPGVEIWRREPDGRRSIYGVMEIDVQGSRMFETLLTRAHAKATEKGEANPLIIDTLTNCTFIVSVEVMFVGREMDETRAGLAPIWDCLTATHTGLTQVDDEGFYRDAELILEFV